MKFLILVMFVFNAYSSSVIGRRLCFKSLGQRANIIEYFFDNNGEGLISGIGESGEYLFQDEIEYEYNLPNLDIYFPGSYYYRHARIKVSLIDDGITFKWLNISHEPTNLRYCEQ